MVRRNIYTKILIRIGTYVRTLSDAAVYRYAMTFVGEMDTEIPTQALLYAAFCLLTSSAPISNCCQFRLLMYYDRISIISLLCVKFVGNYVYYV
jgi:hypothetical protein